MAEKLEFVLKAKDAFSKTLGSLTKGFKIASAAAVAAGAGLAAMTALTAKADDEIGKFAGRLGVTSEALSTYQHIADLSGVSNQNLNLSWQRMTRRVREAATGAGEAQGALKDLGLEAASLSKLKADEQFEKIAEKLSDVDNQAERVRLAFKLFDSEGVGVVQMLDKMGDSLDDTKQSAMDLGLVVSAQAAQAAAMFQDSLLQLGGSLKGVQRGIAQEAMPSMIAGMRALTDIIVENRAAIVKWAGDAMMWVADFAETWLRGLGRIIDFFRSDWVLGFEATKKLLAEFGVIALESIDTWLVGLEQLAKAFNFGGALDDNIESIQRWRDGIQQGMVVAEDAAKKAGEGIQDALGIDPDAASDKIDEYVNLVKSKLAGVREEIAAAAPEDTGLDPNLPDPELTATQLEALNDMYLEAQDRDMDRLTNWYETQQALYKGNKDAMAKLDVIYKKKQDILEEKTFKERLGGMQSLTSNLLTISKKYGRSAFEAWKASAIATTLIETYSGAQKAFNSLATIPIIGTVLGIAAAAVAVGAGLSRVSTIKSTQYGAAHGGLTSVPNEQTFLLQRGERVLSPNQNADLTGALAEGGIGGAGQVSVDITVLPNATNVDALLSMSVEDWVEIVEDKIKPAMQRLTGAGVTV